MTAKREKEPMPSQPQEPVAMTQENIEVLAAGGPKARALRRELMPDLPREPLAIAAPREEKAVPASLTRRDLAILRRSGPAAERVRAKLERPREAAAANSPTTSKERPSQAPPKARDY
jgi:hypothetical protein